MKTNVSSKNLNLLPILVAVVEEGSLSAAADRLRLSQPALSHSLAKLRDEFSDPLFVRSSRGLIPTPKAEDVCMAARPLLSALEQLYQKDTEDFSAIKRQLYFASTTYFELQIIEKLFREIKKVAPYSSLNTLSLAGEVPIKQLERGHVDLAVAAYFEQLPGALRVRVLGKDPIVCLVRKGHPYLKSRNRLKDFIAAEHVNIAVPPDAQQGIDLGLKEIGESRKIICFVNNFLTAPLLLKKSDFIITCPRSLANFYAKTFGLEVTKSPIEVDSITPKMIWHERFQSDPFHRWIRQLIVDFNKHIE